jgi:hypothetical protein
MFRQKGNIFYPSPLDRQNANILTVTPAGTLRSRGSEGNGTLVRDPFPKNTGRDRIQMSFFIWIQGQDIL